MQAESETVGQWLAHVDGGDSAAWDRFVRIAARCAHTYGAAEPDDVAAEFVAEQVRFGCRDVRKARPGVPLAAWIGACIRRRVRRCDGAASKQDRACDLDTVPAPPDETVCDGAAQMQGRIHDELARRVERRLTPLQRAAWQCHADGLTRREAAARLGVSVGKYHDRLRSARAALTRPERRSREWASAVADRFERQGDLSMSRLLATYAGGRPIAECAVPLGIPPNAARLRIARVRAKIALPRPGSVRTTSRAVLPPPNGTPPTEV